jgi:hypothetical protein
MLTFITEMIPSCLVRLEVDIYNVDDTLSCLVRLDVNIYNRGDTLSCMVRLEVESYNGRLYLVMSSET